MAATIGEITGLSNQDFEHLMTPLSVEAVKSDDEAYVLRMHLIENYPDVAVHQIVDRLFSAISNARLSQGKIRNGTYNIDAINDLQAQSNSDFLFAEQYIDEFVHARSSTELTSMADQELARQREQLKRERDSETPCPTVNYEQTLEDLNNVSALIDRVSSKIEEINEARTSLNSNTAVEIGSILLQNRS